jgi:hypothetical protein
VDLAQRNELVAAESRVARWCIFHTKIPNLDRFCRALIRVARFFLVHDTKTGKYVPKDHKMHQNGHKISQMSLKYFKWP